MSARTRAKRKRREAEAAKEAEAAFAPTGVFFGNWEVLSVEDRRATCRCRCGTVRTLAISALERGEAARSCGCTRGQPPRDLKERPGARSP
jgi:hypothetical protein